MIPEPDLKLAFIVCNEFLLPRAMEMLHEAGIDYYTRWGNAQGKGRGTEPHLGTGSYGSINTVLMIGFEDEAPLEALVAKLAAFNAEILRPDDRIRLFQVPLERIV
jgi:hypothetical protein